MYFSQIPLFEGRYDRDGQFADLGLADDSFAGLLTYCESVKYIGTVNRNPAAVAVVSRPELAGEFRPELAVITSDDPRSLFFLALDYLAAETDFFGRPGENVLAASARVHPSAVIAERGVVVGERTVIGPHVVIEAKTTIGDDVVIDPGAVLGGEGFQLIKTGGRYLHVKHGGGVTIGDRVRIGANSCVDRGLTRRDTLVDEETKVDNLVHIAHGCRVGRRCALAAGVCLAGSAEVGDDVWIAPGAVVLPKVKIGAGAYIGAAALVTRAVAGGETVMGRPSGTAGEMLETEKRRRFLNRLYKESKSGA